jgi:hypothetical protein
VQFSAELTKKDYAALRRYALFRHRRIWVVYLAVGVYVAWTSFPDNYAEDGGSFWSALVAVILLGAIATAVVAVAAMALVALLPDRPGAIVGEHVFTLTDSEFQERNPAGSMSVRFELLRRHETAKHVFLMTPTHVAFILPKHALESAPDFRRVVIEKTSLKR